MQRYEYEITTGGNIKYGAPDGRHDDCVVSLALAAWGIRDRMQSAQVYKEKAKNLAIDFGRADNKPSGRSNYGWQQGVVQYA